MRDSCPTPSGSRMTETIDRDHKVGSVIAAALAFLLLCIALAHAQTPPVIPNPDLTPGVANPAVTQDNIKQTICVSGWTKTIRPSVAYTNALKRQQLMADGYSDKNLQDYEEDHLISLEIGGHPTNSGNLWPELWNGPWGAHAKDKLENRLHAEVCAGRLSLADAQAAIRGDWRVAYCHYFPGVPCPL
jgi:hypothetical protein